MTHSATYKGHTVHFERYSIREWLGGKGYVYTPMVRYWNSARPALGYAVMEAATFFELVTVPSDTPPSPCVIVDLEEHVIITLIAA